MAACAEGDGSLPASHVGREQVLDALKAAGVQRRLAKDEFDLRVGQVLAAYAELDAVTAGIPAGLTAARQPEMIRKSHNKQPEMIRKSHNKRLIQRGTAAGAGASVALTATVAVAARGNPVISLVVVGLAGIVVAVLLAGLLTLISGVLEMASSRQPSLGPRLLAELEIPAAHVTHDRDEALSIGDDLAVIVGGQLRQTGPAANVASEPADPDIARLLGWSELGHGTAASGTVRIGQLVLRDTAERPHGPVQAFYRPEDVELRPTTPDKPADGSLTAPAERIILTRPLARITLGCDPPIAALMLHRDINRLQLTAGNPVQVHMPPGGLRVFRTRTEP